MQRKNRIRFAGRDGLPTATCSRSSRAGVTLTEMLIVMAILASLMTIGVVAAYKAMQKAKAQAQLTEISQMSAAMGRLVADSGNKVPPNMGGLPNVVAYAMPRADRFMDHMRSRWPAQRMGNSYTAINQNLIQKYYCPLPGGGKTNLDLDSLDQAEALVFWMGGFPNCYGAGTLSSTLVSSAKLIGFSTDAKFPFKLDPGVGNAATRQRTSPNSYFAFDESRLVDNDMDGWLEYAPETPIDSSDKVPPYVFFDGPLYATWISASAPTLYPYPASGSTAPWGANAAGTGTNLIYNWGTAVPYASTVDASGNIIWINPTTFQIVAAGLDRQYGPVGIDDSSKPRIPVIPAGNRFVNGTYTPGMDKEDEDNLISLANSDVKTYIETAAGMMMAGTAGSSNSSGGGSTSNQNNTGGGGGKQVND